MMPTDTLFTPLASEAANGISAGAIAGICVVTTMIAVSTALMVGKNYEIIAKTVVKNILHSRKVSRKVYIEPEPEMDAECGGENIPELSSSTGSMSAMDALQNSTTLDVQVVSGEEDLANDLPPQRSWAESKRSLSSSFLSKSLKYQPLVLEDT